MIEAIRENRIGKESGLVCLGSAALKDNYEAYEMISKGEGFGYTGVQIFHGERGLTHSITSSHTPTISVEDAIKLWETDEESMEERMITKFEKQKMKCRKFILKCSMNQKKTRGIKR